MSLKAGFKKNCEENVTHWSEHKRAHKSELPSADQVQRHLGNCLNFSHADKTTLSYIVVKWKALFFVAFPSCLDMPHPFPITLFPSALSFLFPPLQSSLPIAPLPGKGDMCNVSEAHLLLLVGLRYVAQAPYFLFVSSFLHPLCRHPLRYSQ